jgi:hypothetical protein
LRAQDGISVQGFGYYLYYKPFFGKSQALFLRAGGPGRAGTGALQKIIFIFQELIFYTICWRVVWAGGEDKILAPGVRPGAGQGGRARPWRVRRQGVAR